MEDHTGGPTTPSPEKVSTTKSRSPSRLSWIILSVVLACGTVCIILAAALSLPHTSPKPLLQVVRFNFQTQPGSQVNQSAFVNKHKNTVTYYITSPNNQTSSVLFDRKNGYICYKPSGRNSCYLRMMDTWDHEAVQMAFNLSDHRGQSWPWEAKNTGLDGAWLDPARQLLKHFPLNCAPQVVLDIPKEATVDPLPPPNDRTQYYREFLAVVPGRQVRPEEAGEAARALCEQAPIYWVKKKEGPPKQRLIYLCVDICFPSNICISICFYYLPE